MEENLSDSGERLSEKSFCAAFRQEAERLGLNPALLPRVSVFEEIDSTNSEILRRLAGGGECSPTFGPQAAAPLLGADGTLTERGRTLNFSLVAAASQSAGRGRIGRHFYSPPQSGVYFSFLYVPEGGVRDPGRCTVATAVAVCRAIDSLYGIRSGIKWVNDIYVGGKKVCGILTEGFSPPAMEASPKGAAAQPLLIQAAVVGIGINMRTGTLLPPELAGKAGGVADQAVALGCPEARAASVSRAQLLACCMAHILRLLSEPQGGNAPGQKNAAEKERPWGEKVWEEYESRSILTGKDVTVSPLVGDEGGRYRAKVLGIGKDFSLRVRTRDGQERTLTSGEVSLHWGQAGL